VLLAYLLLIKDALAAARKLTRNVLVPIEIVLAPVIL
jgi:hypothetical protein